MPRRQLFLMLLPAALLALGAEDPANLAKKLRDLNANVLATDPVKTRELSEMLYQDVRARLRAANQRDTAAWRAIRDRADWERYREVRIKALRASLGPEQPRGPVTVRVTGKIAGDGYRIENIVYQSRPGLWVTANLYLPADPRQSVPGILICHSHHNPKTQGELQDMGVIWARLGCAVLVMDQLGHGERRQHPFVDTSSYDKPYRVGRQDYFFRHHVGLHLALAGESLTGWMAHDLSRGVDVLLDHAGADKERIALLGAVAGGGDPAAVAAALDDRIKVAVPFNFGGPQPETRHPLPADAADAFNYAGSGSWEPTRNLRHSARDGFLPWVIVGAVAPRGLIYAHEFAWDKERDPVWQRLQQIYGFYRSERLAFTHGSGRVSGSSSNDTHCNNIGAVHRVMIYPPFERWLKIPVPAKESRDRHSVKELTCLTGTSNDIKVTPARVLAGQLADNRRAVLRRRLPLLAAEDRRRFMAANWDVLLGGVTLQTPPRAVLLGTEELDSITVERVALSVERDVRVPCLLMVPARMPGKKLPVVVCLAQEGKQRFLKVRSAVVARLLHGGVAICLPDVRGAGETRPGDGRGRTSSATALSSSEQMLGGTLLGARLRDVAAVLAYLADRAELDSARTALWGESFQFPNPPGRKLDVPLEVSEQPALAEPTGALLATFAALYHPRIHAVVARGGLVNFRCVLDSPFINVPHDTIVPGALTAGDIDDVYAALAPRPLRLEGLVDGRNRRLDEKRLETALAAVRQGYAEVRKDPNFTSFAEYQSDDQLGDWLLAQLARR